jgi:hypothetical protein
MSIITSSSSISSASAGLCEVLLVGDAGTDVEYSLDRIVNCGGLDTISKLVIQEGFGGQHGIYTVFNFYV